MANAPKFEDALVKGAKINEFRIISVLGQGGFGLTYKAQDTSLGREVAIKEFLPTQFAVRSNEGVVPRSDSVKEQFDWGMRRFLDEARTLAHFRHPNIVQVLRYFTANGTAYVVMEFENGQDFLQHLKKLGHKPTEAELKLVLIPLLKGLATVHDAGFLHRDIKPSNIYIRNEDRSPVLLDFGAARSAMTSRAQGLTAIVTPGYAPLEQYFSDGNQGPWSDIYALGAVLYRAVTGKKPADAASRTVREDRYIPATKAAHDRYSQNFLKAIDWALEMDADKRPQVVADWVESIDTKGLYRMMPDQAAKSENAAHAKDSEQDQTQILDQSTREKLREASQLHNQDGDHDDLTLMNTTGRMSDSPDLLGDGADSATLPDSSGKQKTLALFPRLSQTAAELASQVQDGTGPQSLEFLQKAIARLDDFPEDVDDDIFDRLIELGLALSDEPDRDRLLEKILLEAKSLANAEGGTLYLRSEDDRLYFAFMHNDTLGLAHGGTTGRAVVFPPLSMYHENGYPNHNNVATRAALTGQVFNIEDVYDTQEYDFSGTREFDQGAGYRTQSLLTVPMTNHRNEVVGVLQLINARNKNDEVCAFDERTQSIVRALASQASVAIENQRLVQAHREVLEAFIEIIAQAIDAKSPYTSAHCQRVPVVARMLAMAAVISDDGKFANFELSEDEWYTLHLASWLHDCGKITTPEYVVDKATKLETIHNRIHEIRNRFEILRRDAEIEYLEKRLANTATKDKLQKEFSQKAKELRDDFTFVARCNTGGQKISAADTERLDKIAAITWHRHLDRTLGLSWEEESRSGDLDALARPGKEPLLQDRPEHDFGGFKRGELYNLKIPVGTLTPEERSIINKHHERTVEMVEALPFPKELRMVRDFSCGSHQQAIKGAQVRKDDPLSLPAAILQFSDFLEAITAHDRPYRRPRKLSQTLYILNAMSIKGMIDRRVFMLFLKSGLYLDFAKKFMREDQIDAVDIGAYTGS